MGGILLMGGGGGLISPLLCVFICANILLASLTRNCIHVSPTLLIRAPHLKHALLCSIVRRAIRLSGVKGNYSAAICCVWGRGDASASLGCRAWFTEWDEWEKAREGENQMKTDRRWRMDGRTEGGERELVLNFISGATLTSAGQRNSPVSARYSAGFKIACLNHPPHEWEGT